VGFLSFIRQKKEHLNTQLQKLGRITFMIHARQSIIFQHHHIAAPVRFYWPKGLLNNRKATTHWLFCEQMANQYRNVQTLPDTIFVRTGCIYTAGIDLALSPVEEDGGWEVAAGVARHADFHAPPGPVSGER
jgi:hypothetical protein